MSPVRRSEFVQVLIIINGIIGKALEGMVLIVRAIELSVFGLVQGVSSRAWCHRGPKFAKVETVIVKDIEIKSFTKFEIHRS